MRPALAVIACVSLSGGSLHGQSAYESQATFPTEAQAEARATELDVGSAAFIGPTTATVGGFGEFTLRFTAGASGMATGGALRISTQHDFEWDTWGGTRLQNRYPGRANFVTFRTSTGSALRWRSLNLDFEYFPWQRMNEFVLEGEPLLPGDTIDIVFGDRSGGSPGVVIQPMDESVFDQRVFVDALGTGEFLPLPESPRLRLVGASARQLVVFAPTDWVLGESRWNNVWLDDGLGNPASGYWGTVTLAVEAGGATLPAPHAYREEDASAFRFDGISFSMPGRYRVLARDSEGRESRSNPIIVHGQAPARRILWGDLHTHTRYVPTAGEPRRRFSSSACATPRSTSARSATTPSPRESRCGRTSRKRRSATCVPAST